MPFPQRKENKFYLDPVKRYGRGYSRIINCTKRYLVLKGGVASKKSWNIAERWIELLTKYKESNLLVVRRWAVLNQNSTYAELKKAIRRMSLDGLWQAVKSPMEIRNRQTGQKILFRGCDDPDSLASITVDVGYLNFVWIEEAFQLERKEMFDRIDDRVRGKLPPGYFAQITLTFNPWNEKHWLNETFFQLHPADTLDESQTKYIKGQQLETQNRLAITTNYRLNEFLDETDIRRFEEMKRNQPQRYQVAGLGHWGVVGSVVYTNWKQEDFDWKNLFYMKDLSGIPKYKHKVGLDFGFSASFAVVGLLVDEEKKEIYVYDEIYESRITDDERIALLQKHGWLKEPVHCDSNVPEELLELKRKGASRFFGVKKERGSVTSGIQKIRGYKIIVHPRCENFIIEISHYQFRQDQFGKELPEPKKEWDHCCSGDTLVDTVDGQFQIKDLVGKQVALYSADSHGRRVIKKGRLVRQTQPSAQLYRLMISDGRVIRTTGNHLFRVKDGKVLSWKRMDELRRGDVLLDVNVEEARLKYVREEEYLEKPFTGILVKGADGLTRIEKKTRRECKGIQREKVEVDGITFYEMDNGYFVGKSERSGKILHLHSYLWKKENGNIPEGYEVHHIDGNRKNNSLDNMVILSKTDHRYIHGCGRQNSPQEMRDREIKSARIRERMREARVLYPDVVVDSVQLDSVEPVYNLEVDGTHCFSVFGGVIIHNCMDAMRYAMTDESVGTTAVSSPQQKIESEEQRLRAYIKRRTGSM